LRKRRRREKLFANSPPPRKYDRITLENEFSDALNKTKEKEAQFSIIPFDDQPTDIHVVIEFSL
jgi:hypothetical protein